MVISTLLIKTLLFRTRGIAGEMARPVRVAQNHERMATGTRSSSAVKTRPMAGCDTENLEVVSGYEFARAALGLAVIGDAGGKS